jgi:hypothetical protein
MNKANNEGKLYKEEEEIKSSHESDVIRKIWNEDLGELNAQFAKALENTIGFC